MARTGTNHKGGRPTKAEEAGLSVKLDKHIPTKVALTQLFNQISEGNMKAIELYLAYRFGKPAKELIIDAKITNEIQQIILKE